MNAGGRYGAPPLLPSPLRSEADAKYHVRAWLGKIGIPDCQIRAEERPAGGAIHPFNRMDLYLLEKRVVIEVKRQGRLSRGPHEKGTGSGGSESAYGQVCRYVAEERRQERLYQDGSMSRREWIGAVTDGHAWWVWLWPADQPPTAAPEECAGWAGAVLGRHNAEDLARIIRRECTPATRRTVRNGPPAGAPAAGFVQGLLGA